VHFVACSGRRELGARSLFSPPSLPLRRQGRRGSCFGVAWAIWAVQPAVVCLYAGTYAAAACGMVVTSMLFSPCDNKEKTVSTGHQSLIFGLCCLATLLQVP
jgi:hypothetical protein